MTGWLAAHVADVKAALTDFDPNETHLFSAEQVHVFNPERLIPPAAVIRYGSPMIEDGETFGDLLVRNEIDLVPMTATNETMTLDVQTMIETAVEALIESGYSVQQVGQPYMLTANNGTYLAVTITVVGVVRP